MIPLLLAFIGLVSACAIEEFLRHARWIDRIALVAAIVLGVATRPGIRDHRITVADAIRSPHGVPGPMMGGTDRAAARPFERVQGRGPLFS